MHTLHIPRRVPLLPFILAGTLLFSLTLRPAAPLDTSVIQNAVERAMDAQTHGAYEVVSFSRDMGKTAGAATNGAIEVFDYDLSMTVKCTQPLYTDVPVYEYAGRVMEIDTAPAREAAQALAGPNGPRLRQLAEADAAKAGFAQSMRLVYQTAPVGAQFEYAARVRAILGADNHWQLAMLSLTPRGTPPKGSPLIIGDAPVYDIMKHEDITQIREKVTQGMESSRRILQLLQSMPATPPPAAPAPTAASIASFAPAAPASSAPAAPVATTTALNAATMSVAPTAPAASTTTNAPDSSIESGAPAARLAAAMVAERAKAASNTPPPASAGPIVRTVTYSVGAPAVVTTSPLPPAFSTPIVTTAPAVTTMSAAYSAPAAPAIRAAAPAPAARLVPAAPVQVIAPPAPAKPARLTSTAMSTGVITGGINIPGVPTLPVIIPYFDAKAYAWVCDTPTQAWRLIPRNEARVLDHTNYRGKQLIGELRIDGNYDVPVVSGRDVLLLFRKETDFKTYAGLPAGESGFEVVKLDVKDGYRKGQLIRTAQLQRLGESAATFGDKREPITVQKLTRIDGVFHAIRVNRALPAGRYALYLPDRAFEFEVNPAVP